jgi:hypothetical protein
MAFNEGLTFCCSFVILKKFPSLLEVKDIFDIIFHLQSSKQKNEARSHGIMLGTLTFWVVSSFPAITSMFMECCWISILQRRELLSRDEI